MQKVCFYCSLPVRTGYVEYEDKTICCSVCKEHYPSCFVCGKPAKQHFIQEDKLICSSCKNSLKRCHSCQKFILGKSYRFGDARYCFSCYDKNEKCAVCGVPLLSLKSFTSKICSACMNRSPKCGLCGNTIIDKFFKNEQESLLICESCYFRGEKCFRCGAPTRSQKSFDGKVFCKACSIVSAQLPQTRERSEGFLQSEIEKQPEIEKQYTFLVAAPTNLFELKRAKEPLLVNNCLKNYHEYVKRIVTKNHGFIVNVSGETILSLFDLAEDAVIGAKNFVQELEDFNRQYNKLPVFLSIRVGLNSVEKSAGSPETVDGSVTDLAYRVLEMSAPRMILITQHTYNYLGKSKLLFERHKLIPGSHLNLMTYRMNL